MIIQAVTRAARSVTTLCQITDKFDQETNVPVVTTAHSTRSDENDVKKVACVLLKNKTLIIKPGRKLNNFKNFNNNPLNGLRWEETKKWILKKKKQMTVIFG